MSYMPPNNNLSNSAVIDVSDSLEYNPSQVDIFSLRAGSSGTLTVNFTYSGEIFPGSSFFIEVLNNSLTPIYTINTASNRSFTLPIGLSGNYYIQVSSGGDPMMSAPGGTYYITTGFASSEPTYSVTADKANVDEGAAVTYTVSTTNVAAGTIMTFAYTGINGGDLVYPALAGNFTIGDDGKATVLVQLREDKALEGPETIVVSILDERLTLVASAAPVTINDTSKPPTYSVTANKTSVNEDERVVFTVYSSDISAGSEFTFSLDGISSGDLDGPWLPDVFLDKTGTGSITLNLKADEAQEGDETFILKLEDYSGAELARSSSVTVRDTSNIPKYFLSRPIGNASYQEGGGPVKFGSGIALGKDLYYYATVNISEGFQPGDVIDILDSSSFISYHYNKSKGILTALYYEKSQDFEKLFNNLVFHSTSDNPTNYGAANSRTFTWSVMGGPVTKAISNTISIVEVNDAPTINTTQSAYKAIGANYLHLENTGITIADPDSKALSLSLNSSDGKLKVSAGSSGATISQLNETSVVVSGNASQINSILEGAGDASITFDPFILKNSKSEIKLIMSDGELASELVSLTIEKQLIQDIFPKSGNGGLFGSSVINLQENLNIINNIFLSSNNSPLTIFQLNEIITKIEYVVQNSFIQAFYSGPYSAQQNHDTCNIIGSIYDQSVNIINNTI